MQGTPPLCIYRLTRPAARLAAPPRGSPAHRPPPSRNHQPPAGHQATTNLSAFDNPLWKRLRRAQHAQSRRGRHKCAAEGGAPGGRAAVQKARARKIRTGLVDICAPLRSVSARTVYQGRQPRRLPGRSVRYTRLPAQLRAGRPRAPSTERAAGVTTARTHPAKLGGRFRAPPSASCCGGVTGLFGRVSAPILPRPLAAGCGKAPPPLPSGYAVGRRRVWSNCQIAPGSDAAARWVCRLNSKSMMPWHSGWRRWAL